jgi:DNA-binding protein H-NS
LVIYRAASAGAVSLIIGWKNSKSCNTVPESVESKFVDCSTPSDAVMKKINLDNLSIDELWQLHEELNQLLSVRLSAEKRALEKRLAQLRRENEATLITTPEASKQRRAYPRVFPKYRNPNVPNETWSGRGKQPRWLTAALKTGRSLDDFLITNG